MMRLNSVLHCVLAIALIFCTSCAAAPQSSKSEAAAEAVVSEQVLEDREDKIVIGVSLQGLSAPFIVSAKQYLEEACEEAKSAGYDVDMVIRDGENDAYMQISQLKSYVKQGMDAIILNPISYTSCTPGVDAAYEANIPVVSLMTRVENQDKCISFSGNDHYDSGFQQAEYAAKSLGGKGNIMVIEGVMGMEAQFLRMQAYKDVLKNYPEMKLVGRNSANWKRSEAVAVVAEWLDDGKQFDAILAQNDDMAMGALKALKDADLEGKVFVSGIDGNKDALLAVHDGLLGSTCYMNVRAQSKEAFKTALNAAIKSQYAIIEKSYIVPLQLVTKDNVEQYLNDL